MKIGILTMFYKSINWGGVLQGYALKQLIEDNIADAEVDIINYVSSNNIVYQNKLKQALQYSPIEVLKKTKRSLLKKNKRILNAKVSKRWEAFNRFRNEVNHNCLVWTDEMLPSLGEKYDCLICGSDQIWNPNVAKPGYFLKNIENKECTKISYAASIARDSLSSHEKKVMIPFIKKFDYISVREKTAKKILDACINDTQEVKEVLDPAMIRTKEQWCNITGDIEKKEKYAFAFFFSDSLNYRNEIKEYCKKNNLSLKYIPFASGHYLKNDERGYGERLYDVGPIEFLKLFQGAECVFTDSFHGTVFSILFNIPFCVFERDKNTKVSKNSRLYDLLEKFDLNSRLVNSDRNFEEVLNEGIDFAYIEEKLEKYRQESLSFLINAIGTSSTKQINNIGEQIKNECNGCGLCKQICPKKAITMYQDEEGYFYPKVDRLKCTNCSLCVKDCNLIQHNSKVTCFVGVNKDDDIKFQSSSGGVFYAIANKIVNNGGCVFGAAFTEGFDVKHIKVESKEQLDCLMRSKYVQSNSFTGLREVIDELKRGRGVLYSGSPCQVAAIKKMATKYNLQEQLLLVDFVCHGVPSPKVWRSYITNILEKKGKIKSVNFRDKTYRGWHDFCLKVQYDDGEVFVQSHELDSYMRSFLGNKNLRPSCYQCKYKGDAYYSDITLADAWKIEKEYPEMADDKGTSLFMIRSAKGLNIIKSLSDKMEYREVDYDKWKKMSPTIERSTLCPQGRTSFWDDFSKLNGTDFWEKQEKSMSIKKRSRYYAKRILKMAKIDVFVRKHF